jgi:GTPase-activating protein SAC7
MQDSDLNSNVSYLKESPPLMEPEKRSLFGKFKAKVAHMKDGVRDWEAERDRARSPPQSDTEKSTSSQNWSHVSPEKDNRNGKPVSPKLVKENIDLSSNGSFVAQPHTPVATLAIPEEPASIVVNDTRSELASEELTPTPQAKAEMPTEESIPSESQSKETAFVSSAAPDSLATTAALKEPGQKD